MNVMRNSCFFKKESHSPRGSVLARNQIREARRVFSRLASKVGERVFRFASSRESAFTVFSRQECFEYVVETSVFEQKVDRLSVDGAKGGGVRERRGEPGVDEQRHATSVSNRPDVVFCRHTQSFPHDSHRDVNVHPRHPRRVFEDEHEKRLRPLLQPLNERLCVSTHARLGREHLFRDVRARRLVGHPFA